MKLYFVRVGEREETVEGILTERVLFHAARIPTYVQQFMSVELRSHNGDVLSLEEAKENTPESCFTLQVYEKEAKDMHVLVEEAKSPSFDNWKLTEETMIGLLGLMVQELGVIAFLSTDMNCCNAFLKKVAENYNQNPFHNFAHGFCIAQMTFAFIQSTRLNQWLSPKEKTILIISAVCHDLDHPGTNNAYQIATHSKLAILYNDQSPIEMHHTSLALNILTNTNMLSHVSNGTQEQVMEGITWCILGTDMSKHGECLTNFNKIVDSFDLSNDLHRKQLIRAVLKCADVSNELRPADVADQWLECLLEEFFKQAELEKLNGIPVTPFMDKTKVTKANSQIGFLGFVVIPLFYSVSKLLTEFEVYVQQLRNIKENQINAMEVEQPTELEIVASSVAADTTTEGSVEIATEANPITQESKESLPKEGTDYEAFEQQIRDQCTAKRLLLQEHLADSSNLPLSYSTNSKKESLVLEFIETFVKQYTQVFPSRKPLFITPTNECGVNKFVCTTIRPTQLLFKELYEFRQCAKFVADYIEYIPLDPPHELKLNSPTFTLSMQIGNCIDFSIVLVSLLRGVGYDAYIVIGYADRDVTIIDETQIELELPRDADELARTPVKEEEKSKYKLKERQMLESKYLKRQRELKEKGQDLKQSEVSVDQSEIDQDELQGLRVHAWVLLLPGKREIKDAMFIEPTTGKVSSTENEHYMGVESVFNNDNYWVNMQSCADGIKGISFDLADNAKWEFVFTNKSIPALNALKEYTEQTEKVDDVDDDCDLPRSWVSALNITPEQFDKRCPTGSKTVFYKNCTLETFADYHRQDGLSSRQTYFTDTTRLNLLIVHETDKLILRVYSPPKNEMREFFDYGKALGLKEHVVVDGQTQRMEFFPYCRLDGLYRIVENKTKTIFYYEDREDLLFYKSVTFAAEDMPLPEENRRILRMTEKFARQPGKEECIAKIKYDVKQDTIRVEYHLRKERIIAANRTFKKPTGDQKAPSADFATVFEIDRFVQTPTKVELVEQLNELVRREIVCAQSLRADAREAAEILTTRMDEEKSILLTISLHDTIRNKTDQETEKEEQLKQVKEKDGENIASLDYLSPFLLGGSPTTKEEAMQVKDACLKSFKERIVERANIIQQRLEEETSNYHKRQVQYSRNAEGLSAEETEEYVKYCNETLFRIHILEKRLNKHKETSAENYAELEKKIKADARLKDLL